MHTDFLLPILFSFPPICSYNSYQELYRAFIPLTQSYMDELELGNALNLKLGLHDPLLRIRFVSNHDDKLFLLSAT